MELWFGGELEAVGFKVHVTHEARRCDLLIQCTSELWARRKAAFESAIADHRSCQECRAAAALDSRSAREEVRVRRAAVVGCADQSLAKQFVGVLEGWYTYLSQVDREQYAHSAIVYCVVDWDGSRFAQAQAAITQANSAAAADAADPAAAAVAAADAGLDVKHSSHSPAAAAASSAASPAPSAAAMEVDDGAKEKESEREKENESGTEEEEGKGAAGVERVLEPVNCHVFMSAVNCMKTDFKAGNEHFHTDAASNRADRVDRRRLRTTIEVSE